MALGDRAIGLLRTAGVAFLAVFISTEGSQWIMDAVGSTGLMFGVPALVGFVTEAIKYAIEKIKG